MARVFVFDTSAWIALDEGEDGADRVERLLEDAWLRNATLHSSFVTLTEMEYIRTREQDAEQAAELLAFAKAQPVEWHHSDDAICHEAARLKSLHKVSFADAFIAALANRLGATLVHKDPEFVALGPAVKQLALPMKPMKS